MIRLSIPFIIALQIVSLTFNSACSKPEEIKPIPTMANKVPTEGNSWIFISPNTASQQVLNFDNSTWTHPSQVVRTYFWIKGTGNIEIGIRAKVESGNSKIKGSFHGNTKEFSISSSTFTTVYIGSFNIEKAGYYYLDLAGVSKSGSIFAEVSDILLGGNSTGQGVNYVFEEYFYWGRRGPSVHLGYQMPQNATDVKWFYNEVNVPEGNDVIGSFFMANGHSQGYFGIQVNSLSERRVLFSIWSPYQTDNPNDIPAEYRVILLAKGDDVVTGEFGNEGSGGQSFLRHNWKAGNTYKFLTKIEPAQGQENKTDYTGYFFDPEIGEWKLIASWRRPFTSTYAKGLHSFLENFDTRTGPLNRKVYYGNQWVYDTNNQWHEVVRARFTTDPTGRNNARLDYAGGSSENGAQFFLKNCGFFSETTTVDTYFNRTAGGTPPSVDLSQFK